eukprot:COSAG02_NODE_63_length_43286_cov_54.666412_2_plen_71_part_00
MAGRILATTTSSPRVYKTNRRLAVWQYGMTTLQLPLGINICTYLVSRGVNLGTVTHQFYGGEGLARFCGI